MSEQSTAHNVYPETWYTDTADKNLTIGLTENLSVDSMVKLLFKEKVIFPPVACTCEKLGDHKNIKIETKVDVKVNITSKHLLGFGIVLAGVIFLKKFSTLQIR